MENKKKEKQDGFFKVILDEIGGSLLSEVIWNIIMFIPRMIIRLIKNI
jgi:hypothetical protein